MESGPQKTGIERIRQLDPTYLPKAAELKAICEQDLNFIELKYRRNVGYELLTEEYIKALGGYVSSRLAEYKTKGLPLKILEVGAGNGRLSHFLKQELAKTNPEVSIVATGTHDPFYGDLRPVFPVEDLGYQEALAKHEPTIVLCSWMPMHSDWSADFRQTRSVQEYILIGQADGACGKRWETYGGIASRPYEGAQPPYVEDGFKRTYVEEVEDYQFHPPGKWTDTATYSFRREVNK